MLSVFIILFRAYSKTSRIGTCTCKIRTKAYTLKSSLKKSITYTNFGGNRTATCLVVTVYCVKVMFGQSVLIRKIFTTKSNRKI